MKTIVVGKSEMAPFLKNFQKGLKLGLGDNYGAKSRFQEKILMQGYAGVVLFVINLSVA